MGVIAVETRPVEMTIPADPANPDSEAKVRGETSVPLSGKGRVCSRGAGGESREKKLSVTFWHVLILLKSW